jgi:predicted RNase H-like nuclease (RuvC/YqgF family)
MVKEQLQKELNKKIRPGIKPSDLKKERQKPVKNPVLSSPIVQEEDEGYVSEEEEIIIPNIPTKKNFKPQIESLKKQLELYKDFKEADLKIKEQLKGEIAEYKKIIKELEAKIKEQYKTIEGLKNPAKNTEKDKEPVNKTFFCDGCQITKQGEYIKRKIDSPFELRLHGKTCYLCSSCSPYYKELNDSNFDKDNNPYKLY